MKKRKKAKVLKYKYKKRGIGFTNRLVIYILLFLAAGLVGGFYLALKSIEFSYMGALYCWTVVFTPIGTAASIAIGKAVDKSKAENTVGGIKYQAMVEENNQNYIENDYDPNNMTI